MLWSQACERLHVLGSPTRSAQAHAQQAATHAAARTPSPSAGADLRPSSSMSGGGLGECSSDALHGSTSGSITTGGGRGSSSSAGRLGTVVGVEQCEEISRAELDHVYASLSIDAAKLPELEAPPTMLTPLRPYQKQALGWMVSREADEQAAECSLEWLRYVLGDGTCFYVHSLTGHASLQRPRRLAGTWFHARNIIGGVVNFASTGKVDSACVAVSIVLAFDHPGGNFTLGD